MTVTELPRRVAETATERAVRWEPSRAGILNVWRYYDEELEFHEGRLLLRGPNGTGKSKALELLLPFLFDANLRANRLSTFGTGERTMHWNLMGEGASGTTRVGYVWLEFRFPGAAFSGSAFPGDADRWFCCGARLQASTHTTTVHSDYFTTDLRIGRPGGLSLLTDAGQPLTKSVLEERLGEHGTLHPTAADYRAAVRSTLFPGLSEQRYDALITALLQLRTPKLSQRLDPSLLSSLLSRALPPLGQQEIVELAEGFERLDRQRERLARLDEEVQAARTLAGRQRTYVQRVLRAASATLISSTTELDNLTRTARRSAEEYQHVAERKAEAANRIEVLSQEQEQIEGQITGLTDSDAYRQGRELDKLRQQVRQAHERAAQIRADADGKRAVADTDEAAVLTAQQVAGAREGVARDRQADAMRAASRANLAGVHTEIEAYLDADVTRARQLLRGAVNGRHAQVDTVRRALDEHERAVTLRRAAEDDLDSAREDLSAAQNRHTEAAERHELEVTRLAGRLREWVAGCRELSFPDPDELLGLIESEAALLRLVETVAARVLGEITRDETITEAERDGKRRQREELAAELENLRGKPDLPPDPPRTRTADRSTMTGAPLWRLVRFTDSTPEAAQGPIEAALEAAGLLDAWVGHTGAVEGHDIFADPYSINPVPGASLADVLLPEPDCEVPAATVRRLLACVAYGERLPAIHPAAIGADGGWRLGNLTGTWHKDQAAHIGALARERARQLRMNELSRQIHELDTAIAGLDSRLDALRARRVAVANERDARPDHRDLAEAARELTLAESAVTGAELLVRRRIEVLGTRERAVADALRSLTALAAEHAVPSDRASLDALARAVDGFREIAENWLDAHHDLVLARQAVSGLARQAERSGTIAAQREGEASLAERQHRTLTATLDAVESTVGMDYRQVLAELDELRTRQSEVRRELDRTRHSATELAERLGALDSRRTADAAARDLATETRDRAAHRFRHLAGGSFPTDSGMDDRARFESILSDSEGVRAALDAARLVAATWPALPHAPNNLGDALHRLSESVHACRTALSDRADLDLESDEDVQVFTALVNGVRVGAAELLTILRAEAERSRREITERERELFDQTLTGDTRRHLAARIRQAGELVDAMNARLERVRTASKVAVRLVWQVAQDLPPGTRTARELLLKDPVRLTDADREALHRFFRDRIEQAKAADTATSWEQQLAQVFDYTTWHQFVVKVNRGNGADWQLLTKKLHGALSGGEKAIALHLPLFAAVAAHYQATPRAPRLILLDEVFVGVDSSNRGQVFGLLSALDLDLVLTSDHEWCTYQELSGIAIHQLITGADNDDAVTTARFVWNGHDLVANDANEPTR
jgi:uncharacterized protein (TIGR02680 family)